MMRRWRLYRKKNHAARLLRLDLNSPATAEAFEAMAKAYTKKATKSKAAAIKTLQREGILTKGGRLTRRYAAKA
jgi:hypothetical protein